MDTLSNILSLIESKYSSDAAFEVAAGLKPKTVYDWKRGKSASYLKMLPKLSDLFNVSTDCLLGNEQKNKPATERDELKENILNLFSRLSPDGKKELIEYAQYKVDHQAKK